MMRQVIFGLGFLCVLVLSAQPRLEFEKVVHDFGQIKEADGAVEYAFVFENKGDQPLLISGVRASCGCTTPFWTNEPVMPGEVGKITARYNTINRPGPFNKTLSVTSNAAGGVVTLMIRGQVEPKVKTIEDHLPTKYGVLRMGHRSFNMGKITTEKTITKEFDVYNDSDSVVRFVPDATEVPAHITVTIDPVELQPKQKGVIRLAYDPIQLNALGYQKDKLKIQTDEQVEGTKELEVVATLEEYFPPMTQDELANAPKLSIDKKLHDFGRITAGSQVEASFTLTNVGKSELKIRQTASNCDCVVADYEKDTLQPGESIKLKVTFDSKGRRGRQYKNIAIFSNDPAAPTQVVNIRADM